MEVEVAGAGMLEFAAGAALVVVLGADAVVPVCVADVKVDEDVDVGAIGDV